MTRNIIVVGSDSIRADHCSCYGYHRETTPFIDSLAKEGFKFENSIVNGLATRNSFMGIFTGDYSPLGEGVIRPEEWRKALRHRKTLAQILSKNGYNVYGFSLNPLLSRHFGFHKSSKYYYDGLSSKHVDPGWWGRVKRYYIFPIMRSLGLAWHLSFVKNFLSGDIGYIRADEWIGRVLKTKFEEPYFLWIFFIDTHYPHIPPKEYTSWSTFGKRRMMWLNYKLRRSKKARGASRKDGWTMAQQKLEVKLSQREQMAILNGYDDEILHIDAVVKRLWEHFQDSDPIFIFHSDHGEALGEHGFYGHPPEHYEELIRVPLIIYNANRRGTREEPVSLLRFAPTICELAGIENEFSHPSLFKQVLYSPPIVENKLNTGMRITVRDKDWKLINNPGDKDELYHLRADPLEQSNLIEQEKHIEEELRRYIEQHKKRRIEMEQLKKQIGLLKDQGRI